MLVYVDLAKQIDISDFYVEYITDRCIIYQVCNAIQFKLNSILYNIPTEKL